MSLWENVAENHEDGKCGGDCCFCKLERGEITQEQFDELWADY